MFVTITNVTFPRPGGKYGKLATADGKTIWAPQDLLAQFRIGMACEIGTKDQTWGAGTPTAMAVTVATTGPMLAQGSQIQGVQAPYGQGAQTPYVSRETAVRPNTGFQPRVVQGGQGQGQPQQAPFRTPREMFISEVVAGAMEAGKAASEIAVFAKEAARTWDEIAKPAAAEPPPPEPGDPGPELQ
jgi:hypothetical protein